ncbi:preprotein translocase subunit SecE [Neisseria weaveri]|uniref:Protein translocase subunit SecE n=1 Tax=Neisseria weaveri TaxID=28091 RepID=A0A448VNS0_9NEIS|nr:hypothetical protein l11_16980 [Neisseria weaveri LMG 5135]SAY51981.1 preprotein translocase subunit SecE [Neisseria weaveri]VEJ51401.1 preprotein translocase subunit SecE [Neisseria weaveri]
MIEQLSHDSKKSSRFFEVAKFLLACVFVVSGIWGFYYLVDSPSYVRVLLPFAGILLALVIVFYWCESGKKFLRYIRDSYTEFKKVVWLPRNDAMRMTGFVIVFVAILSVFIYLADSAVSWLFFDILLKRG